MLCSNQSFNDKNIIDKALDVRQNFTESSGTKTVFMYLLLPMVALVYLTHLFILKKEHHISINIL